MVSHTTQGQTGGSTSRKNYSVKQKLLRTRESSSLSLYNARYSTFVVYMATDGWPRPAPGQLPSKSQELYTVSSSRYFLTDQHISTYPTQMSSVQRHRPPSTVESALGLPLWVPAKEILEDALRVSTAASTLKAKAMQHMSLPSPRKCSTWNYLKTSDLYFQLLFPVFQLYFSTWVDLETSLYLKIMNNYHPSLCTSSMVVYLLYSS